MRVFPSLVRNIAITGIAYSVISVVGLLLAPFLIAIYGLTGYGQILLARMFLPNASFGFLDFGIGETATRSVAEAAHGGEWDEASRVLTFLSVIALGMGAIVAAALIALAFKLPIWLSIAPDQREGFTFIMIITAALMPFLFLSLVAEGALKGLERFKILRSCEIASALTYGALALALGLGGSGPNWIAAALLAGLVLRLAMAATAALKLLRNRGVRLIWPNAGTRGHVINWSRVMLLSKILGTLQNQVAGPIIGFVIGPAAVGAYDAAVRLPRFAKSVFSLISTTVLPAATGLKTRGDEAGLTDLGRHGILAAFALTAPIAIFALVFSESILRIWIGEEVAQFWGWQSAMFLVALLNVPLSFGGAILLADRRASQRLLNVTTLQVAVQIGTALFLLSRFEQWAFIIGQTLSVAILFYFQFRIVRDVLNLGRRPVAQLLILIGAPLLIAATARIVVEPDNFVQLIALAAVCIFAAWFVAPWLVLKKDERRWLKGAIARKINLVFRAKHA